ncbi:MAG: hypothetical protein IPM21_17975 [Acidobacteria bacterium]|nr:hypothetical protein [Acidobacteriota bacterium]
MNQETRPEVENKTDSPVTAFGVFSNIDGNGVHESGYAVELWSYEGDLVGFLIGSAGTRLVGDPPTGILRDVMYNSDTGLISFRARIGDVDHEFDGNLAEKRLSGRLFDMSGRLQSQRCDEAVKIVLPRSQKQTDELEEYPSYEKWKEDMNEILKFRGFKETAE